MVLLEASGRPEHFNPPDEFHILLLWCWKYVSVYRTCIQHSLKNDPLTLQVFLGPGTVLGPGKQGTKVDSPLTWAPSLAWGAGGATLSPWTLKGQAGLVGAWVATGRPC